MEINKGEKLLFHEFTHFVVVVEEIPSFWQIAAVYFAAKTTFYNITVLVVNLVHSLCRLTRTLKINVFRHLLRGKAHFAGSAVKINRFRKAGLPAVICLFNPELVFT